MSGGRKRLAVTGREGQVVRALLERGAAHPSFEIIPLGRPDLDLAEPARIGQILRAVDPSIIVSAAAYTGVDQAEEDADTAMVVNGVAPGVIAETAAALGVPIIHISTDYVFDGAKATPYVETDPVGPIGSYGRSKLAGERAIAEMTANYVILRTAWVYSPFGKNFVKTMLRLAESRDRLDVVDDQLGNPTSALDIADVVMHVAGRLLASEAPQLRGVCHMTGSGEASWADFATEIFIHSARCGGPVAQVKRIATSQYPTPARRPANSRLDCSKLENLYGVRLPGWKQSAAAAVERLLRERL